MPAFGSRSLERLRYVHPALRRVFETVVARYDCAVLEGYRNDERQAELLEAGKTTLGPGLSTHQGYFAQAGRVLTFADILPEPGAIADRTRPVAIGVDVAPYYAGRTPRIDWQDEREWHLFAGYVFRVADELEIPLRWGGDWDGDRTFSDQTFDDYPHWELLDPFAS